MTNQTYKNEKAGVSFGDKEMKNDTRKHASLIGQHIGEVLVELLTELLLALSNINPVRNSSEENSNRKPGKVLSNNHPSILTAREVAEILRLSKSQVYRMIQEGDMPAVRFGRTTRVRRQDLDEFILSHVG